MGAVKNLVLTLQCCGIRWVAVKILVLTLEFCGIRWVAVKILVLTLQCCGIRWVAVKIPVLTLQCCGIRWVAVKILVLTLQCCDIGWVAVKITVLTLQCCGIRWVAVKIPVLTLQCCDIEWVAVKIPVLTLQNNANEDIAICINTAERFFDPREYYTDTCRVDTDKISEINTSNSDLLKMENRLYKVCEEMNKVSAEFPIAMTNDVITKHLSTIANVLWFLHPSFDGFNDWRKKKHKACSLGVSELERHSSSLFNIISCWFTAPWGDLKDDLEILTLSLSSYASFLQSSNDSQQKRQQLEHPVRVVGDHAYL
ncbi:unnamed protein product [Mytilus coruscus]|uniref:Uncharacterized protein n=1 Tax=Mytilus coruscus TaxID=42192 RepID=A0A6J8EP11_MYTCO|nr:unnamed protein product [Mytilus coruscus]